MELLSPSHPPRSAAAADHIPPLPTPARCRDGVSPAAQFSRSRETAAKVHVAVGRSPEKTACLLVWTFRRFQCREIGLVHVHQPSPTIPTLLGKIPATQANEELVSAYRREEMKQTRNILLNYLRICQEAQVSADIIMIETEHVQKGIVDLVNQHSIRKLVMGSAPVTCLKVKRSFSKVSFTEKNVPLFCEIWFICNGRHAWTREASEDPGSLGPVLSVAEPESTKRFRSSSLQSSENKPTFNTKCTTSQQCRGRNTVLAEADKKEEAIPTTSESCFADRTEQFMSPNSSTSAGTASPTERRLSSEINLKEEKEFEFLHYQLIEARAEAERLQKQAFAEIVKCKELESAAAKAFSRMKAFEVAHAHEVKLREELEVMVKTATREREELLEQKDEAMIELQNAMRTISILDNHAQEVALRRDEAAGELNLIQASIVILKSERQKIQQEREESLHQLERLRCYEYPGAPNCDDFVAFSNRSFYCREFSLSDIQTATCNFSESFKLGQRGYGCVYKGEMSDRSVIIKQLHPHNVQGHLEFQKEVHVLSKLRHPHLVNLIGSCPEAWSLVFEYLPNGSLQNHLIRRTNAPSPLTWKVRARIATEISSALLFLHSSKPEKIIHGNLSPENILLDSDFNCKIADFGICRLVPEETIYSPSFCRNTEPKGAFSYADPEYQRTGVLTPKSDVYSLGIIVLQLLTGRQPLGLVSEVRRAVPGGKLSSVLDPTAGEWPLDVALRLAEFGLHCSEMNSRDRPELTSVVVRELNELHVPEERPVPPFFLCPVLKEIMNDPLVAADGFTYEGRAIRGWLEKGRETSPMTNLKLNHLDLTPNHALRLAIQDWLCSSR